MSKELISGLYSAPEGESGPQVDNTEGSAFLCLSKLAKVYTHPYLAL